MHEEEFAVPAEWHFFAKFHGKGLSDGHGGTLKRNASRGSLQRPADKQIKTPVQLYEWAVEHLSGMNFYYITEAEVAREQKALARRFRNAAEVKGIRQYHAVLLRSREVLCCNYWSLSPTGVQHELRDAVVNPGTNEETACDQNVPADFGTRLTRSAARRLTQSS